MDGLVVGEACANAWTILGAGAFAFMTVEDRAATDAMRQAAEGVDGDPGVVLGDTGSAGWAGFLAGSSGSPPARAAGVGIRQPRGDRGDRRGYRPGGVPPDRRQEPRRGGGEITRNDIPSPAKKDVEHSL